MCNRYTAKGGCKGTFLSMILVVGSIHGYIPFKFFQRFFWLRLMQNVINNVGLIELNGRQMNINQESDLFGAYSKVQLYQTGWRIDLGPISTTAMKMELKKTLRTIQRSWW
ncbi:uncharacterized protein PGTG_08013 [Puccinia graminis f. sp. tritici CRL 75-36-700-3]|uniref:Transmembrane protein n=1 Tax=Puccinia graminis f. sp. tritici (strain CRL 75-36-700-3 / race SCCL) TaxID=418459 RepID=E3KB61_PUCGT|nr:uncharacterized protein PGTG_08013 [Puccinia graminis f. sp. tritici CRL 75-36-700-3]EFP81764.1 hypothetical protein PGTG_08013 [Puccinia graminis f. sp. tritici CRL 75-36-700-3]